MSKIFIADKATLNHVKDKVELMLDRKGLDYGLYNFGIKFKANKSNQFECEYLADAKGMKPIEIDKKTGTINYNGWDETWFLKECYPVLINLEGYGTKHFTFDKIEEVYGNGTRLTEKDTDQKRYFAKFPKCFVRAYVEKGEYYIFIANYQVNQLYVNIFEDRDSKYISMMPFAYRIANTLDSISDYSGNELEQSKPLRRMSFEMFLLLRNITTLLFKSVTPFSLISDSYIREADGKEVLVAPFLGLEQYKNAFMYLQSFFNDRTPVWVGNDVKIRDSVHVYNANSYNGFSVPFDSSTIYNGSDVGIEEMVSNGISFVPSKASTYHTGGEKTLGLLFQSRVSERGHEANSNLSHRIAVRDGLYDYRFNSVFGDENKFLAYYEARFEDV